jgi:ATP-dependent Zn protease
MSNKPVKKSNRNALINLTSLLAVISIIVVLVVYSGDLDKSKKKDNSWGDLISEIKKDNISSITITSGKKTLEANIYDNSSKKRDETRVETYPNIASGTLSTVVEEINQSLPTDKKLNIGGEKDKDSVNIISKEAPAYQSLLESPFFSLFINLLIFALIALFIIRRLGEVNSRSISFGNSRAKSYDELNTDDKITFKDVAGNEEAKLELIEKTRSLFENGCKDT